MHAGLGLARCAGREGDDADIVGGGVHIVESRRFVRHARFQAFRRLIVEQDDVGQMCGIAGGLVKFARQGGVTQGHAYLREISHIQQLTRAQQRHGGNGDGAYLHHREPTGRIHGIIAGMQQHPVAGLHAKIIHQDMGDTVGLGQKLAIIPGYHVVEHGRVGAMFRGATVQDFRGAIDPVGQGGQFGEPGKIKVGPGRARRQIIRREMIHVGTGAARSFQPCLRLSLRR